MEEEAKNPQNKIVKYEIRQGPLPDPSELQKYDNIQKGFADRIMGMAEKEQSHRHKKDIYPIRRSELTKNIGQFLGFILSVILVGAGSFLIYSDKETHGLATIFLAIASVAGAFIYDRKRKSR